MKKFLFIFLISCFSLTVISCSDEKEEYSATDNTTTENKTTNDNTTTTDTTSPTVESISPTDNQGGVSISDNISVTFSVAMDNSSVTTNSSNTSCSGSLELSSDNFSNCIQMSSSPSSSNSEKTFTIDPSDNLSRGTTYKTRVTTGVKDSAGNTLGSQYETSSGFTTWSGTQQLGTSSGDTKTDGVTVDSSGNIYVTGYTSGGLDNNTNSGSNDIFLVKYNSSGVKQWTKQLGTSNSDVGRGVTVDSSDNIYVTGSTSGGLDDNTNTAGSSWDFFLVKYNSSGVKQWTEQYGSVVGGYTDFGQGVTVDSSDNLYVTGTTNGGIDNNTSSGSDDIFLIKYNSSGEKQWTQQLGTSSRDRVALDADEIMDGVTVDSSDNIYVVGQTQGGLDNNTNSGDWDFFLVKYNSSGTKQWTQQLGTSSKDVGNGVAVDSSNNIYVTGTTGGGLDNNTSFGSNDIFLVKYNSSGEKQWTQQLGGHWYTSSGNIVYSHNDAGTGVTVDSSNNIYVTGSTSKVIVDGSNTSYGGVDTVLVKYNSSGVKQWAKQLGSSGHDYGQGVTVDSFNNIYVTGKTDGGLDGNTNSGSLDVFLVKYNSDGVLQ